MDDIDLTKETPVSQIGTKSEDPDPKDSTCYTGGNLTGVLKLCLLLSCFQIYCSENHHLQNSAHSLVHRTRHRS